MRIKNTFLVLSFVLPFSFSVATAQEKNGSGKTDDLTAILDSGAPKEKADYTTATFKTTRIANGQSIENLGAGILDFRINHRFGDISAGASQFFGLDNASTRLGFDYGVTDWLMVGIGRSTYLKDVDGFLKVKLLRQKTDNSMPISVSYVGSISVQDVKLVEVPAGSSYPFSNRVAYINQLLIARKFSNILSLQLMPTLIHYNFVQYRDEPNNLLALGVGGRVKVSNRVAVTCEYYPVIGDRMHNTYNSLSVGVDIETGGHVFQLLLSNSTGITERTVIGQTTGQWKEGEIHFGFNISRVFTIVKPKGFENSRNKIW